MNVNNEDIKKKRGRKKKDTIEETITIIPDESQETNDKLPKKRGRKPKGGKIITAPIADTNERMSVANIILHLKCSIDNLNYNEDTDIHILRNPTEYIPDPPPNIMAYVPSYASGFSQYGKEPINEDTIAYAESSNIHQTFDNYDCPAVKTHENIENDDLDISMKDIQTKIKQIKIQLYQNSNPDKKSACFWCTYDYDNPTCYIPKYEIDGELCGYGSFCRPECAVAYLLKENVDDSIKFERYHLLNKLYSTVYNFKKNIKPAPDPHYLLDKFYGKLTIQEYRKLMKTDHMLLVIEKPMTRILPELHENTDDMENTGIHGSKGALSKQSGVYKVKRQSEKQKGPSKNDIMKENFGF